jgi:hypothetical protein
VEKNRWVRYGQSGVAAAYIQDAGTIRINNLSLSYLMKFKKCVQQVSVTAFASNILLWSAYNGTDPGQFLNDDPATSGLDYFNLPSTKNYGVTVSIQF